MATEEPKTDWLGGPVEVELTYREWTQIMAVLLAFDSTLRQEDNREIIQKIDMQVSGRIGLDMIAEADR